MRHSDDRTGRYVAAVADLRRGAADSQGAVGAVRLGRGRCWRRRQRTARGAGRRAEARCTRSPAPTTRSTSRPKSPCAASTASTSSPKPTPPIRVLREIHDPPGVLFVRGELKPQRRPGHRHRRHAARHAVRPAAGRAAGRRPGPGGLDDHQRPGPGHRRRGPSRRAGGRRADHRRAGQRRDEHLPARTRQLAEEVAAQGAW